MYQITPTKFTVGTETETLFSVEKTSDGQIKTYGLTRGATQTTAWETAYEALIGMLVREKFGPLTDLSAGAQLHKRILTRTQMERRGVSLTQFRVVCRDGVSTLLDPKIISRLTAVVGKGFDDYSYNRYVSNRHAFDPLVDTNQLSVVYLAIRAFQQPFESSADVIKHVRDDLDKPSWNALQALPVQWLQRHVSGVLNELGTIYEICTGLGRQHRTETRAHVLGTLPSVSRYKYRLPGTSATLTEWMHTLGKLVVEEFDTEAPMAPARIVEDLSLIHISEPTRPY